MSYTFGRECNLGWGYDKPLDWLTRIDGDPPNVKSKLSKKWDCYVYDLSFIDIPNWGFNCGCSVSAFLQEDYKKLLDFSVVFDTREYFQLRYWISERYKTCEKHPNYLINCGHYVNKVYYGTILWVVFPKTEFPKNTSEVSKLFKENTLNEAQKKVDCKVLINYNKVKKMTLEELLKSITGNQKEENDDSNVPFFFNYETLNEKFRETKINHEWEFREYLSYLYIMYRKIEIKMEKLGCQQILPAFTSDEESFIGICGQLLETKRTFISMDKNDFLKIYPVVKKLFFWYMEYIKFSIKLENNMDEGDHLPGTIDDLKSCLYQLNTWFPIRIKGKWKNCNGQYIGTPPGFEDVVERLHGTTKFNNCQLVTDEKAVEPYIGGEEENIIFGLIDMEGTEQSGIPEDSKVFEWGCPAKCIENLRRWICTKCGNFVFQKDMILYCSCGSKKYSDNLLSCSHPNHHPQSVEKKKVQEPIHPPVPCEEIKNNQNHENLFISICEQLRKIRKNRKEATDPIITDALIDLLWKDKTKTKIEDILKQLQNVTTLDRDTQYLISQYLNLEN